MSLPTTTEPTVMTGTEFWERILKSEYSQRELAKRWGVSHTTIQRECDRDEVRGHFRDAILRVTENDSGNGPSSPVAGSCAQAITGVLENVRDRLRDKRDFYRRSKDLDSIGREKMAAAENAMDNGIVIVEQFLDSYREEHE